MKYKYLLFLLALSVSILGQSRKMPPPPPPPGESILEENDNIKVDEISKIEVIGSARIIVKPDIGTLFISLSEKGKNMKESILNLESKTNYYSKLFRKKGFKSSNLKTNNFEVELKRKYKDNEYIDDGYVASQNIMFEFDYSEKMLKKVLSVFYESKENANFRFKFRLSESLKAKVQKEIIVQSVKDGKEKAEIMAKNSDQKIIKLLRTTYGVWSGSNEMEQLSRETEYFEKPPPLKGSSFESKSFTPNDLIFYDTVKMIFAVE